MNTKFVIRELRNDPKVAYYFLVGNLFWFLFGWVIKRWYLKSLTCKKCFETGICQRGCGCDFNKVAVSGKKCNI
jgi:hypothetical protein